MLCHCAHSLHLMGKHNKVLLIALISSPWLKLAVRCSICYCKTCLAKRSSRLKSLINVMLSSQCLITCCVYLNFIFTCLVIAGSSEMRCRNVCIDLKGPLDKPRISQICVLKGVHDFIRHP